MQDWNTEISDLAGFRRQCMEFLAETLPMSDIDSYPFRLFLSYTDHALMMRENSEHCAALDRRVFMDYVLYPRVNNEDLSDHRAFFYSELNPRVKGLSAEDAVLEVNRWCAEHTSYEAQDSRTASPLTVYRSGSGRCGEESAFAVSALRSIGIPARQVYVPRWAHCDDNHAWVEAYCDGAWRFFGACEPEPILDRGWFNAAASRAMLVHSRRFAGSEKSADVNGSLVDAEIHGQYLHHAGAAATYNQTARYAPVKRFTTCVTDCGKPAAGAVMRLEIPNFSELYPIAELVCGEDGTASFEAGIGDFYVTALRGGKRAEGLCSAKDCASFHLELSEAEPAAEWLELDFSAPEGTASPLATLTATLKEKRKREQESITEIRNNYIASFRDIKYSREGLDDMGDVLELARGNAGTLAGFLAKWQSYERKAFLRTLSKKDYRDVTPEILEDHFSGSARYAGRYPGEIFLKYVACPRIADEMLTAWRGPLSQAMTAEQRGAFISDPSLLWKHLCDTIRIENSRVYSTLYWTPDAAFRAGRCDEKSLDVLFVALLRAWGAPARLSKLNRTPEYWNGEGFIPVKSESAPTGTVIFKNEEEARFIYGQNWSLSRRVPGGFELMSLRGDWQKNQYSACLPPGGYRLLTSSRLPNGNQLCLTRNFEVRAGHNGDSLSVPLRLRGFHLRDALTSRKISEFKAETSNGVILQNPYLGDGRPALLFWLEIGAEPTEHILNELAEARDKLKGLPLNIVFMLNKTHSGNAALNKLLADWPEIKTLSGQWEDSLEAVSRALYCDPGSLPLAVACDSAGNAVYANSGYNVGLVEQLAGIMEYLLA